MAVPQPSPDDPRDGGPWGGPTRRRTGRTGRAAHGAAGQRQRRPARPARRVHARRAALRPPAGRPLVQPRGADRSRACRWASPRCSGRSSTSASCSRPGPGAVDLPLRRRRGRHVDRLRGRHRRRLRGHGHGGRPPSAQPLAAASRASTSRCPGAGILVLGGDEVYPAASTEGYEDRLEGPWRAALPWTPPLDPDTRPPAAVRHPRQPRLVRRADRVPAPVRPGPLDRRLAHPPDPQLLRRPAAAPLVAVGRRHPVRRPHRRTAARLLRAGGRRALPGRRPRDPGHAGADLDPARARARGLPQPRLLRAGRAAPRRHRPAAHPRRRPPPLRPVRAGQRQTRSARPRRSPPGAAARSCTRPTTCPATATIVGRPRRPATTCPTYAHGGSRYPTGAAVAPAVAVRAGPAGPEPELHGGAGPGVAHAAVDGAVRAAQPGAARGPLRRARPRAGAGPTPSAGCSATRCRC